MISRDASACADALEGVTREALDSVRRLEAALADERAALEERDAGKLDEAGTRKQQDLVRLEHLDGQRRHLLTEYGYPEDDDGVEMVLSACPGGHPLTRLWQELAEIAGRCRDTNAANGAIVHLRRRQIARALDVLRGAPDETASVYAADGSSTRATGRAFGSA